MNVLYLLLLPLALLACRNKEAATPTTGIPTPAEVVSETPPVKKDSTFLVYERSPCFGMCPVFSLTIYESGYAVYEGRNFVNNIGFYHTHFSATALQKVIPAAEEIGYFGMLDSYDNPHVTDLPTVTTGIRKDGVLKFVVNRYKAPKELQTLYQLLDEMIQQSEWKPMPVKAGQE